MTENSRRHVVYLNDSQVQTLKHATLVYAAVLKIKTAVSIPPEADENARLSMLIQEHTRCPGCAAPKGD